MIRLFEALGLTVLLAAPTGRAAKRLTALCGQEGKTIHRLLEAGFVPGQGKTAFARCPANPLEGDVVILDEVSMVDISLMEALLRALRPGTRLVLVGDSDQLPPVGPGNLLRDIIRSGRFAVVESWTKSSARPSARRSCSTPTPSTAASPPSPRARTAIFSSSSAAPRPRSSPPWSICAKTGWSTSTTSPRRRSR